MADFFYPYHYPSLKHESLAANTVRINVVDQTGEVLAWWDENSGQETQQFDPFSIYACNLDLRTSKEEIFGHFCSLGEILRITFLKNKKTNIFNGSIYVQFKTIQSAEEALYLDGSYLRGQMIYVKARVFSFVIFLFKFFWRYNIRCKMYILKTLPEEEIKDLGRSSQEEGS